MNTLESQLKQLPEPLAPERLTVEVTARIARVDAERTVATGDPQQLETTAVGRGAWATLLLLAGAITYLGAESYRLFVGEASLDLIGPRVGAGLYGFVEMLPVTPAAAVMATGLLLYLAGLLATQHADDADDRVPGEGRALSA